MDPLRQYDIAFVGLKAGVTNFNYHIDDRFFALFEGSLVEKGVVEVTLKFDKQQSFFNLQFQFNGTFQLPCDRCGVDLNYPVDSEYSIVVKFDEHYEEEQDDSLADIVYIARNETRFNVAQLIYEFVNLSIPINHVNCDNLKENKPCDQEVLSQLNHSLEEESNVDHRWDALTKIKFN